MNPYDRLISLGFHLSRGRGENTVYVIPRSRITDEIRQYVRDNRNEILKMIDLNNIPPRHHINETEGLGDWTERQLKKIGVTEEWYKHVKEKFGLTPTCGCGTRKRWLNSVSDWWNNKK